MVAALAAAKRGVRALILEKGAEPAGNTVRSTGLIPAAGTRFQREAGILDDTPELMAHDIFEKNNYESDPELTRLLCEESAPLVEWLADEIGCEMICYTDFLYPGQSRLRMHGPETHYGSELARQLESAVRNEPRIELLRDTPVRGLAWDKTRVSGVETADGTVAASAVILALNGFGGNREMVEEYLGSEAAAALYYGSPNNTGEGIRWGVSLGAATGHMGSYQGHASVAAPDGPLVTWGVVVNGAILVNRDGERFGDETAGYSEYAGAVMAQPVGEAWEVFDEGVYEASRGTRFDEVIKAGKVLRSENLKELAANLGLPTGALAETIEETNRFIRGERSDPFGREEFKNKPFEPPFYGIHVRGALFHTQGGLQVDTYARVLRPDGSYIPGLYAGGGTAVGISGKGYKGYSSGNGLLAATVLGKISGEAAAEELAKEASRT
ncbi:MAG: redox proteins related to the succinate dehydrogenases and fumarate reductases [uncultured Rubrobacteraceae bacterium]|uniref:Redox proteins related to the succinate dehydrogenases and fumarate reductases n=1 Tax=uncultured Rubrobacteraceae bacterium TaxID=349277 RepID=A0A6J4QDJ4_9ACTN|nr:MAG: redox proteins related to the succinate dehydrogenases and fumarate reductases [uncultured Rubrobacteraceae bacterium]